MTLTKHWKYGKDEDIVLSHLKGLAHANPSVQLIPHEKVLLNPHSDTKSKVTLISGGGAGHEPLHGGFVGDNLLDAAVSGSIFASPSTKQIMAAVRAKGDKKKGTILIAKNYTGDVLHFGLVTERAKSEGYLVEALAVADDVAVGKTKNRMVGRRGLAGTAIMHKILGAASSKYDFDDVLALGKAINQHMVTLGASLDRTSVPGKSNEEEEFTGADEAELGLGIHNEPGFRLNPIPEIDELLKDMWDKLLSPSDKERHYVDFDLKNDDYVLLVNNIGGTSSLELYIIVEHVFKTSPLSKKPKRVLVSDFVTSLNSPGFSVTLLNLSSLSKEVKHSPADILSYIDAPTDAPGWKPKVYSDDAWTKGQEYIVDPIAEGEIPKSNLKMDKGVFEGALKNAFNVLIKEEPKITHYDTLVGDGDCGETLVNGANAVLNALKEDKEFQSRLNDPVSTLAKITELVEDSMGGTSGGIYSIFLTSLVHYLKKADSLTVSTFSKTLHSALYEGLFKYTKARVGGRTLVDTLQPFVDTLSSTQDLKKAVLAAERGCESTKKLEAKFGRASYVDEKEFEADGGVPDPGAVGLLAIIKGFLEKYE